MSTRINSSWSNPVQLNDMAFSVSGGSPEIWEYQTITKENYQKGIDNGLTLSSLYLFEEDNEYKLSEEAKSFYNLHYKTIISNNLKEFTKVYLDWFFINYPDEVITFG